MKEGFVTSHELKRMVTAIEHEMKIVPQERPNVVVQDNDSESGEGHIVDLDELTCTCDDYQFNCKPEEVDMLDSKYCKHIYRAVFEKHGML